MREPGMGDNSEGADLAERKAVMMQHFARISEAKEDLDEARKGYNSLRKAAKADGIKLSDIDFMLRCADVDDGQIIVDDLRRQAEIAAWFALPVDYQPDMFGDFSREPGEDRARREGRAAGASGMGGNPYDEASPLGRAWAEEWSAEQAKLRQAMEARMLKQNELIKGGSGEDPGFDDDEDEQDEAA